MADSVRSVLTLRLPPGSSLICCMSTGMPLARCFRAAVGNRLTLPLDEIDFNLRPLAMLYDLYLQGLSVLDISSSLRVQQCTPYCISEFCCIAYCNVETCSCTSGPTKLDSLHGEEEDAQYTKLLSGTVMKSNSDGMERECRMGYRG